MPDARKKHVEIPFSGKLLTHEPATIGNNFRTLKNLRYTDTHIKGVAGNTKINVTAISTTPRVRNAYHFRKVQPAESHLLLQCYTTAETTSGVYQLTASIPTTGAVATTALWSDTSGALRGSFCPAPDGQMIYCNGVDSCIWGGSEMMVGAFLTSTAATGEDGSVTNPKDDTSRMNNTKTDGDNLSYIGGGYDSYVELLCHFNGADADTGDQTATTGQTITTVNHAQLDTAYKKFGTASLLLDGTDDYCTVPDSADWYFAAGNFTLDLWYLNPNFLTMTDTAFLQQYVDVNNYWIFYYSGATGTFKFICKSGGVTKASYSWLASFNLNVFNHIELVRNGSTMECFNHGAILTKTETTAIGANEIPNLAATLDIGRQSVDTYYGYGWYDEIRISKGIARHTTDFTPPTSAYLPNANYFLVGSPRPLQGVKLYIATGNSVASTLTGSYWNGSSWATLSLTDNTDTGASLATTGTVTFSSTVTTAKPKFIEGYFLYWYQFTLDAGSATLYQITLDAPFQDIIDLWDGKYRDISVAYKRTDALNECTSNVLRDDYESSSAETYVDLSSLGDFSATGYCLEFGFTERITGLHFRIPPEYNNTVAGTMYVDYWNGTEYVTVGTVSDGTSNGGKPFKQSGTATWNNADIADETKTQKMQSATVYTNFTDPTTTEAFPGYIVQKGKYVSQPLYFYRVRFENDAGATFDNSVRLNYVGGITSEKDISHYKFPVFAQGRILLCGDMSGKKNKVTCSGKWLPQAYNGLDSVDVYIGDEGELTCGTELFSQYGGNLYSLILLFKDTEFWVIAGQDINAWETSIFPISTNIGCPAPQTLKTITLSQEPAVGLNRSLAIWQGANGIYMSDGRAPIPIHGDIKTYFDKNDSTCIKASKVGDSVAFIDNERQEYHWLFASGTSATTLNKELVYDIIKNKWFEIDRGTGMYLQCGVEVQDTNGNQYTYGFIDTGYIERLEYGTSFDGGNIVHTVQFGDIAPLGLSYLTQLDHLKLITVAKTTTTNSVTCTHYGDSYTTGTDKTMSPAKTNYRLAIPYFDEKYQATYHSFKFAMTTSDETIGFEPLAVAATFHPLQED